MAGLEQKLEYFTDSILSEAAAEHDSILKDVEQTRKEAISAAEEAALREADQYIHDETARIRAEQGREISRRMQDHKKQLALRREEIAQQIFAQVRERLAAFTEGPDYPGRLADLFREAISRMNGSGDLILYLRPQDMDHAAALCALAGSRAVEARPGAFRLGGLILDCPSRNLRADQTFDNRLIELRSHFAELAGLSLAGQTSGKEG